MPFRNLYLVLNVPQTASIDELKKAIDRKRRLWNNRMNAPQIDRRQEAERMLTLVEYAEATLLPPAQRAAYDSQLTSAAIEQREVEEGDKRESSSLVTIQDISSHSLGFVALDENKKEINSIVLNRGSPLPCIMSYRFVTAADNQTAIHIQVTEGEDTDLDYVKIVGEGTMKIPPYPCESPFDIRFEYDRDGIVHVGVFDLTGNAWLGELDIERTSDLAEQDVLNKMAKLRQREVG